MKVVPRKRSFGKSAAQLVKMIGGERHGEKRDLCPRRSRGGRLLHRASAAKRSVPRALVALSNGIGHLRRGPVDQHFEAPFAQRRLGRSAHPERARVHRLRRDTRANNRTLRARRGALGARLLDDDRSGLGRASSHSRCADRCRRCYWGKARCVAHLYPAHVGDHAWRADARRTTPRQGGWDTPRTLSKNAEEFSSSTDLASWILSSVAADSHGANDE